MQLQPPPSTPSEEVLVLEVQKPVEKVEDSQASDMIPAPSESRVLQIGDQAKGFVTELKSYSPRSPEFTEKVKDIQTLAQNEIVTSSTGTSHFLQRQSTSLSGAKRNGGSSTQQVAGTLSELRSVVSELTPNAADLNGVNKILGFIPAGKKIRRYFHKYETAQTQLDNIVKSLLAGQDALVKDNAALEEEQRGLWSTMENLKEYVILASKIDDEIQSEVVHLRQAGEIDAAQVMESDLLFAVRQRRQDLLTQLAVSVQGYMAMGLIHKNNQELIKGVDRARTTTVQALHIAVAVANALDTQALVLDQIDAVNAATNNAIEQTAIMLSQQTVRVHEQAANSGVSVETLTKAFDKIYSTMDEIDSFKAKANESMGQTINALEEQISRSRPHLERAKAVESNTNNNNRSIGR